MPSQIFALTEGAPLRSVPSLQGVPPGFRQHQRAVITTTAGSLDSFITWAGSVRPGFMVNVPSGAQPQSYWPKALMIQVEAASSANAVYITFDDVNTPAVSATNGFLVPVAPNWMRLPIPDSLNSIPFTCYAVAIGATANCQIFFEY